MQRNTAIQVIIVRDRSDPLTEAYVDVVRQALTGREVGQENLYFSDTRPLGIPLLDPQQVVDDANYRRALLGSAQSTVVLEILSRNAPPRSKAIRNLLREPGLEKLKIRIPDPVANETEQLSSTGQGKIEPSFLPVVAALSVLEACRRILIRKTRGSEAQSKLFLSHAKRDGMVFAQALVSLLNRLRTLKGHRSLFRYFYDAESIKRGDRWRHAIKDHAETSLFIALRTEEYESRYWCRQEFLWAERNHAPMLVVDLRKNMYSQPSLLPFDQVDTARVADGNLVRVLYHAMRCHIDFLQLRYRVAPKRGRDVVLPRYPSSVSLEGVFRRISKANQRRGRIIYRGQTLPKEQLNAVQRQYRERFNITDEEPLFRIQSQAEWEVESVSS